MASVNVKVIVVDYNDNHPKFYPEIYAGSVQANSRVGDTVVVVKATDADSGVMGNVSYFIAGGNGSAYFSIDQSTGRLH